jgi:hypothetical protein
MPIGCAQPPLIVTSALQDRKYLSGVGAEYAGTPNRVELDHGPAAIIEHSHVHNERRRKRDAGSGEEPLPK